MKKELLLIAAAATMLTACVNTEDFRDVNIQQNSENDGAIGFTSFTENVTKAENSDALYTWTFFNHQESFQVWGRKSNKPANEIFGGTTVNVSYEDTDIDGDTDPDTYFYRYSPSRFWDKTAQSYHFYAAAPSRATATSSEWSWTFEDADISNGTIADGYFTIKGNAFSLNGVNLKHVKNTPDRTKLDNVFKGVTATSAADSPTDIDLLIAAPAPVAQTYYNKPAPEAVNLNFIHILSKLNITISTSLPAPSGANNYYNVELIGFEVKNVPNAGTFNEKTAVVTDATRDIKKIHWTLSTPSSTTDILTGITNENGKKEVVPYTDKTQPTAVDPNTNATTYKKYIVESLIIPQEIKYQRVALDGNQHNLVDATTAVPYQTYADYETAKHNDVIRLTEAQFNALITGDPGHKTFVAWNNYVNIEGETLEGDDGKTTFERRVNEASEIVKKDAILAYDALSATSEPYFHITYTIDGDEFDAYYNLAAAFLGLTNNETQINSSTEDVEEKEASFPFYEGWQNTLNIIINPTEIKFTADVAEWSDHAEVSYEIEKGNENPVPNP